MIIYEACYNSNTEEGSFCTLSLHKTKEGAERVVSEHRAKEKAEFDERYKNEIHLLDGFEYDSFKEWGVFESELLD